MPDEEKPVLFLDQIPELKRMRQLAERLGAAMAGNLPGGPGDAATRPPRKPEPGTSPLEQAVALLKLESNESG